MSSNARLYPNFQCFEAIESIRELRGFINFNPVIVRIIFNLTSF